METACLEVKELSVERDGHPLLSSVSFHIPAGKIKISESGIYTKEDIQYLKQYGYQGFLIGENFMRADEPAVAFMRFVSDLTEPLV